MTVRTGLRSRVIGALDRLGDRVPRFGALLDRQRPHTFLHWTDGLNGQRERRRLVAEVLRTTGVTAFVETGTNRGATAAHIRRRFDLPVWTVELMPRYYELCRWRFRGDPNVHLHLGDSRSFLRAMASQLRGERCCFYLDAHWYDDLPLADELRIIAGAWDEWVVIVDDFKVEGDPKYYYDDYGPGRALEYSYLPLDEIGPCAAYFPRAAGMEESFPWRGCIVLGRGEAVVRALETCGTLRRATE